MSAVVIPIAERVVTVTMGLHDVHVSRGLGIEGDRRKPSARDAVVLVVQLYVVTVDRVGILVGRRYRMTRQLGAPQLAG